MFDCASSKNTNDVAPALENRIQSRRNHIANRIKFLDLTRELYLLMKERSEFLDIFTLQEIRHANLLERNIPELRKTLEELLSQAANSECSDLCKIDDNLPALEKQEQEFRSLVSEMRNRLPEYHPSATLWLFNTYSAIEYYVLSYVCKIKTWFINRKLRRLNNALSALRAIGEQMERPRN